MPRNASGTYSLPSGNPVSSGTLIDANWANNTLNDLANEVTDSLSRSAEGGMLAPLRLTDGVQATPSLAFTNEPSSGLYRAGTNDAWFVSGGNQVMQFTSSGVVGRLAAGAVGTPSLTFFGDLNTGLWSPAADTVALSTGGVERWRVDSSGNVGVGTASPTQRLHVSGNTLIPISNSYFTFDVRFGIGTPDSDGLQIFSGDFTRFGNRSAGGVFTERMRLNASGNLGIGTTSPGARLDVQAPNLDIVGVSTTGTNYVRQRMTNTGGDFYYGIDGSTGANFGFAYAAVLWYTGNNSMVFGTNNTRRMEIDGSGNVMAGGAALATNATNGFLYVPTCAGVPTGTPTAKTGYAPIVVDTTNNRWYFYSGGAWRNAGP